MGRACACARHAPAASLPPPIGPRGVEASRGSSQPLVTLCASCLACLPTAPETEDHAWSTLVKAVGPMTRHGEGEDGAAGGRQRQAQSTLRTATGCVSSSRLARRTRIARIAHCAWCALARRWLLSCARRCAAAPTWVDGIMAADRFRIRSIWEKRSTGAHTAFLDAASRFRAAGSLI